MNSTAPAAFEPSVGAGLVHSYPETRIGTFDFYVATCTEPLWCGSADGQRACGDSWWGVTEDLFLFSQEDPAVSLSDQSPRIPLPSALYAYVRNAPVGRTDPLGLVDINFIDPKEDAWLHEWFENYTAPDGSFTIAAHGNPVSIYFHHKAVPIEKLIKVIRPHPRWRAGMRIRLLACWSGNGLDAYAQRLADALHTTVEAPYGQLFIYRDRSEPEAAPPGFLPHVGGTQ